MRQLQPCVRAGVRPREARERPEVRVQRELHERPVRRRHVEVRRQRARTRARNRARRRETG